MIPDKLEWLFQEYENSWTKEKNSLTCVILQKLPLGRTKKSINTCTAWEVSKYGVISGPYFPVFGVMSEYREIRTRNSSVFGHFSRSDDQNFPSQTTFA